ncbi:MULTISPECIES: hypothetical protein [unclassified Nocardioides]|uniref:hypothetical protein n=1 Tax=unclassified Nocardioides TaxID=2615069 RepID=UPI0009F13C78|nr:MULTISPECIES: hypothetical protein [unclassified Nocardioides]GAW48500.1 uncharacterized protein (Precursor) [Nocardioides sp. PD653-B2]GAW52827.1 uncharacterized protein (Precursor) [Nocardioides sp. PD653]
MSGFAPLGRLISLALICAGLGTTAVLATAETAQAAGPDSPTAIGVSSGGTSYVGFSSGGKLQRLDRSGVRKKAVPLDQDEAVDGLFVSAGDDIWVDYESSVSLLTPRGKVIQHFDHDPVIDCDSSAPASRYGGITANGDRVYVANRCDDSISVYTRNGSLVATVDLPGNDFPRGITYGGEQAGRPATLYVAIPDRAQILSYDASSIRDSSEPARTFTLDRPDGGEQPEPAGLVVDRYGQVVASDLANNALYFLDATNNYSLYRTLGHPPGASREAGRLNSPGAIAQHDQDGGGLSGNLFIADTNNERVQRWSTGGYTYWAKGVRAAAGGGSAGGGGGATTIPVNTVAPEVTGSPAVGTTLSCYAGAWSGKPKTFERAWLRGSEVISGATGTYTPVDFDRGKQISCRVRATNARGTSDWAVSDPVTIPGGTGGGDDPDTGNGPSNITPPSITGTAAVGQTLTCDPGVWFSFGAPGTTITYTYTWKRTGTAIAGATSATYPVVSADSGLRLTCTVRASDALGSTSTTSAAVTVDGSGGSLGPANTVLPSITGTAAVGRTLTCAPGTWTGTAPITYGYVWKRAGTPIAGATAATYTVVTADIGTALTCVVAATDADGTNTATSAALTVAAPAVTVPANTVPPSISGTPNVGQTLTCNAGTWTGQPTITYDFVWRRGSTSVGTSATYVPVAADLGNSLVCTVVATNGLGSAAASSPSVRVVSTAKPANTDPPTTTGTGVVGTALTCTPGTWTGTDITYSYAWTRNGAAIPDTASESYIVLSEDVSATLACIVTATNGNGSAAETSAPRTIAGPSGQAPVNAVPPTISGTALTGQTLTCDPGTWTGDPTITYVAVWQRNGAAIAGGWTHTVTAADATANLLCVVVASNGFGTGAARSSAVGGNACGGPVGVVIAGGAAETTTPQVQLAIRAPAGATTVEISNNSDFGAATTLPVSAVCTYAWTMDSIPGLPLTWSVYVRFDTGPTAYSDSILVRQAARHRQPR